ncbi:hypothetical protein ACC756_36930 [Rhizobium ruizarguesonis]
MGTQIVRVPPGFRHPVDEEGEVMAGGHLEPLYYADPASLSSYQVYENVSDGTPISPVFETVDELHEWLRQEGWDQETIEFLLTHGHAPSLIQKLRP